MSETMEASREARWGRIEQCMARMEERVKFCASETKSLRNDFREFRETCVTQRELGHMRWSIALGIALGLGNTLSQIAGYLG